MCCEKPAGASNTCRRSVLLGHGDQKRCITARAAAHATEPIIDVDEPSVRRETGSDLPEALARLVTAEGADGREDVIRLEISEPRCVARRYVRSLFSHTGEGKSEHLAWECAAASCMQMSRT